MSTARLLTPGAEVAAVALLQMQVHWLGSEESAMRRAEVVGALREAEIFSAFGVVDGMDHNYQPLTSVGEEVCRIRTDHAREPGTLHGG